MPNHTKSSPEVQAPIADTPQEMLKRVFAVAELIVKSMSERENADLREQQTGEKTQNEKSVVS